MSATTIPDTPTTEAEDREAARRAALEHARHEARQVLRTLAYYGGLPPRDSLAMEPFARRCRDYAQAAYDLQLADVKLDDVIEPEGRTP